MNDQVEAKISAILERAFRYKQEILDRSKKVTDSDYASLAGYFDGCLESIQRVLEYHGTDNKSNG